MLPQLVGGISAIYSVGKLLDEGRYWYDYHKTTGHWPRYPFRSSHYEHGLSGLQYYAYSYRKLKRF